MSEVEEDPAGEEDKAAGAKADKPPVAASEGASAEAGDDEPDATPEAADPPPETEPDDEAEPEPAPVPIQEVLSPEETRIRELQSELADAHEQHEQSQARLRTVSKAYTDLQAEMKAFRERMEARAKLDTEVQSFNRAKAFFDPVMNLKRSVQTGSAGGQAMVDGVKMVLHQFMEVLKRLGLEEVPGEGADFDPNVHEALAVTPVTDPDQDGKVLIVHTDGYTVNGKVLQAAQVVIGKYQEEAAGEA